MARSAHLPAGHATVRSDYAERLWSWLDALYVTQPVVLAGHSLGALMVASAARLRSLSPVSRLVLLAPARGYGDAPLAERERDGGKAGWPICSSSAPRAWPMARACRHAVAPGASHALQDAVRETMAQIDPTGYAQAVQMLGQADLAHDLKTLRCPVTVASGEADTVTPPTNCDLVAQALGSQRISLGPVGHACPLEAAPAVNALLDLPALGGLN
jgi:pimeloyl-ACP methyl ester carboxylesterase